MDDEEQDYPEGIYSAPWLLEYAMYHVIYHAPDNAWLGIRKMIEYLVEDEDGDELDSAVALDILARYSLTGWHPRDIVEEEEETAEPIPEEEIDSQVKRFREWLNEEDNNE